jgi:Grx4 family monothiol glutaredoxin
MMAVMTELLKDSTLSNVKFYKLAAEEMPEISMKHEIAAVPTLLLFHSGKAIDRVDGANAAELTKKVKSHSAAKVDSLPLAVVPPKKEDLETKLKRLISAHKCMLFMKGRPQEPKCGFSKQTIAILDDLKADYGTFDILTDDEVRQGLKTYSNWPTYPQLYIDGELMGGLDIIKEMVESGDLQTMIPKKLSLDDRLKSLINTGPLMVFMKGSPATPKCGFSRQVMEMLGETQLKFETFDILTDDTVRQGLKTFSNWPTYPQVYVKGELIGGLDILKELKESGDLISALKGE